MAIVERLLLIAGVLCVVFGNTPLIAIGIAAVAAVIVFHWYQARRFKIIANT